jgi:hypothetical protein
MPDRSAKVSHANGAVVAQYDSDDLNLFEDIIENILDELSAQGNPLVTPDNEAATRTEPAIPIFKCAETGERSADRLKRHALGALCKADDASRRGH